MRIYGGEGEILNKNQQYSVASFEMKCIDSAIKNNRNRARAVIYELNHTCLRDALTDNTRDAKPTTVLASVVQYRVHALCSP